MKTSHFRARRARVARQWELRRQLLAGTFDAQKAKDRKHCRQRLADAREQFQSVDQLLGGVMCCLSEARRNRASPGLRR